MALEYSATGDDERVFKNNLQRARACPEIYRFGVSREHMLWLGGEIEGMRGLLTAIVQTVGGTVEGHPTSRINILQRLRELVDFEKAHPGTFEHWREGKTDETYIDPMPFDWKGGQ